MQADWQKSFEVGQKLRARILYVDAASKRVCLTLLPRLVIGQSAPGLPKGNTLFQARLLIQSIIKAEILCDSPPLERGCSLENWLSTADPHLHRQETSLLNACRKLLSGELILA